MEFQDARQQRLQQVIDEGYGFRLGQYINKGFEIFGKNAGAFIGFTFVYFIIVGLSGLIPFGSLIVAPPLSAGFFLVARKVNKGEQTEFNDFFKGFEFFGPLVIASILTTIFIVIGTILLILPGIFLGVALAFVAPIIIFSGMEFWPAIQTSMSLIKKDWFAFFGFFILLGLINILGFLLLGVGLLVTIPATYCAIYAAYEDIVGTDVNANSQNSYDEFSTTDY